MTAKLDPQLLPPVAQEDLASGDWLFGRGVMDMKFGLAMQLTLTEAYAACPPEQGNILFLSVPDQENNWAGMLHALANPIPPRRRVFSANRQRRQDPGAGLLLWA